MRTRTELRDVVDPLRNRVLGAIRRVAVTLAGARAIWQVAGYRLPAGAISTDEVFNAELFGGIGFHARPPTGGKPEAIVLMVGADSDHPVIVAIRDEATRAAVANALKADETMLFNSKCIIHAKDDGTVEVRTPNGVAVPLATLADVQAIRNALHNHGHTYIAPGSGGSAATTTDNPAVPAPAGTTVLKGQ